MPRSNRLHFWVILTLLGFFSGIGPPGPASGADPVTIWSGAPDQKAVALTFDDGPSPVYTAQIMALLQKYQAHGTFFVMGRRVEQYPGLVQALFKAGHEVGNHSFSHPRLTKTGQLSREQELERTAVDLDLLGCPQSQRLFRPPYSAFDDRLQAYLAHTHRRLVMWSLDSGDWKGLAAPAIIKNVLSRVRNGSIVIFHDSNEDARADRHPTVEALSIILPALKAAGYRMVTVSELLSRRGSPCHPGKAKD
ncbi:MAG: chitooligosaccharide deacetylase [Deltaproteobacteria bacterium CG07_land_8_20_14_0_80_60_11]|nr:MAG: chitooligosaccharide deacetylase [Deltaproteobacteria bacterium CG07_land_8_20_14_0_80_60_11]